LGGWGVEDREIVFKILAKKRVLLIFKIELIFLCLIYHILKAEQGN